MIFGTGGDCAGYIAVYAGIDLSRSVLAQVDSADCNVLGAVALVEQTLNLGCSDSLPVGYGLAGNNLNAVLVVYKDNACICETNVCSGLTVLDLRIVRSSRSRCTA